jgi:2-succinyl-5-enolpyruvyl-6-hydroxy-3-cyclohexene-1-carboxylate synthase
MNTTKKGVRLVAEICRRKGIRKVVFSPGSRSAPLVIAFNAYPEIECLVIPDERVAGYFAMGMAQQLGETVAVVCTSGTAVLNLAPAVCEAFYQNIPMLVITADRPEGAANTGENQAIMQENIFGNHILSKYSIDGDTDKRQELEEIMTQVSMAFDDTIHGYKGPVHINLHMSEPLYETTEEKLPADLVIKETEPAGKEFIALKDLQRIKSDFSFSKRKMIIVGMREYDEDFYDLLEELNKRRDLVIVNENLSNLFLENTVWNIDSALAVMDERNLRKYIPDVVITMGGQIVSKKIKQLLNDRPALHWDIPPGSTPGRGWAMFGDMFDPIEPVNEMQFLNTIIETPESEETDFKDLWLQLSARATQLAGGYFTQTEYSDLKVFETLIKSFPFDAHIQYGNSTPIRYSNLLPHHDSLTINANRGTSGIDGCVSTAAGAAYTTTKTTVCITGDVSFFYDSNALWNNYLSPNLRLIIINNSGGNIFRLIDGPNKVTNFEKFFETRHNLTAEHLAAMYGLPYYICARQDELVKTLKTFYEPSGKCKILEIKTDGILSAAVYKKYFEYLKSNK